MSIKSEINRLSGSIAAAYAAVEEQGGDLPAQQTSANLAAAVRSIPVSCGSNQSFLDNGYFLDPVNQKGETKYTGNGYTIDRWALGQNDASSVAVENGHILLSLKSNGVFEQTFEKNLQKEIYTFSFLEEDKGLFTTVIDWPVSGSIQKYFYIDGIRLIIYCHPNSIMFHVYGSDIDLKLVAVKLELGSEQTLAHQDANGNWVLNDPPPNKALELAKCQRYQVELISPLNRFAGKLGPGYVINESICNVIVSIPVALRAHPTVHMNGAFYLTKGEYTFKEGIPVSSISASFLSTSTVLLNVTASGLIQGDLYFLAYEDDSNNVSLLFDANP